MVHGLVRKNASGRTMASGGSNCWCLELGWVPQLEIVTWKCGLLYCHRLSWYVGRYHGDLGNYIGRHTALYQPRHSAWHLDGKVEPRPVSVDANS